MGPTETKLEALNDVHDEVIVANAFPQHSHSKQFTVADHFLSAAAVSHWHERPAAANAQTNLCGTQLH